MEPRNLISFSNVGTRYEAGPEILSDVSFNINSGQFFFLTGKSGAGKTTLLRLIYHLHKKTRGQIKLFGKNTQNLSHDELVMLRRRMSIVFQEYSLISHLSIFDNVALPLRVRNVSEAEVMSTVMKTLQWVGLEKYAHKNPLSLSGGQQQKVAVARAIITRPQILLADEPTGSLDDDSAKKLMDLFIRMKEEYGSAIIIATHSTALMGAYNFHKIKVEDGTIRFANGGGFASLDETENYFADLSKRFQNIIGGIK